MGWKDDTRDINFILDRLEGTLDKVWAGCQYLRDMQIPEVDVTLCDIEESIEAYQKYTKTYKLAIDKKAQQNIKLKEAVKVLTAQLEEKERQLNKLDATLQLKLNTVDEIVNIVKENSKAIEFSMYTKGDSDKSGVRSPRYRKDIEDKQLIDDYMSDLTLAELAVKYDMSIPGIRNRLMNLGVYKQVYKKDN